jgi:CDP-glucose 4,6-dehydratase
MVAAWGDDARWESGHDPEAPHEAQLLTLDSTRARTMLAWSPPDDLTTSIEATVAWYKAFYGGADAHAMRRLSAEQIAVLSQVSGLVAA